MGIRETVVPGARGGVRRLARAVAGSGIEAALHRGYHAFLRRAGRFAPPEDEGTLRVLRLVARRSATIIDVGANAGVYSFDFLRHARPECRLYAFEPNPYALKSLQANLAGDDRARIHPVALSSTTGRGALVVPVDTLGNPVSALGHLTEAEESECGVEVSVRSLDSLVRAAEVQLAPPILLKIDVEGHEAAVLAGADSLSGAKAAIYFESQRKYMPRGNGDPMAVWRWLEGGGYEVYGRTASGFDRFHSPSDHQPNYLALPGGVVPSGVADLPGFERALIEWLETSP